MKTVALIAWDVFSDAGLSGLSLDFACGAVLAICLMAAVPLIGRFVGFLMECVLRGLSSLTDSHTANLVANYLTFPGVILHELSHAIGAKISGAKLDSVRLFEPDGQSLGKVEFTCRGKKRREVAFQRALSSCAPVLGGFVFVPFFMTMASWAGSYWLLAILSWHGAFSMACHMDMSKQDMKNYLKGCVWLMPYIVMACTVAAYYIGHNA